MNEENTQANMPAGIGNLVGSTVKSSLLSDALTEQASQLGKLTDLLANLGIKLQPVLTPMTPQEQLSSQAEPDVAPFTKQIMDHTYVIKNLQSLVQIMTNNLEV